MRMAIHAADASRNAAGTGTTHDVKAWLPARKVLYADTPLLPLAALLAR